VLNFDNRMLRELPGDPESRNFVRQVPGALWSAVQPTPVAAPCLVAWSAEVAELLDLGPQEMASRQMLAALSGNGLLPGMQPYATRYGGHQFGHWAGQLGDGRAIVLGEAVNGDGERHELQLKGAGPTPYSRRADGRAVLRSSLREFLCSEAMHHLGVPTTRALSLVTTGETVIRDMFYDGHPRAEPGAIVCRVAPSFTRFGHFEILAAEGDTALLRRLVDFTIARDFPQIEAAPDARLGAFFTEVCTRTARLMAHWMRVGFVHGVMNTDNLSILGLTIDYGPYGWLEDFDPAWTPNTTDGEGRRYCFGRQPAVARWNLQCLAGALACLSEDVAALREGLACYDEVYAQTANRMVAAKFGLETLRGGDAELIERAFHLMQRAELDMTEFFRTLAQVTESKQMDRLRSAAYRELPWQSEREALTAWLADYLARVAAEGRAPEARAANMNAVNPRYVLRNYLAQLAIDRAEAGDSSAVTELLDVLRRPYAEQAGKEAYAALRPEWARQRAGCSMLSCSS
jgi:uncharacterized protein YdiU (UPF0061 family)